MKKGLMFIMTICILATSCKKEDDVTDSPEIEFQSISSTQVVQFENSVEITFSYKDRNGDLGYHDPDVYSLRVKDDRLKQFDWYHIPPITPDEMELDVEGFFNVQLTPLFLLGNGSQESTKFTLQLQDRAGNWSNQLVTPVVLINDSL